MTRNKANSETALVEAVAEALRERVPSGWDVERRRPSAARRGRHPGAQFVLRAPEDSTAVIVVETKTHIDPIDVSSLAEQLTAIAKPANSVSLVAAPYLSPGTRRRLASRRIGYFDTTGNMRLVLDRPAVFIETTGADRDPTPEPRPLQSLKGRASGRAVRALTDFRPPYGVRELAQASDTAAPSLSRVAGIAEREALLERQGSRGKIVRVDWEGLLRRWAQDYSLRNSNRTKTFLDPRGLDSLRAKLRSTDLLYAITGSLAAAQLAPIAAPRLATVYVWDISEAAMALALRPAESGANAVLIEGFDPVVFDRTFSRDDLTYAAPTQLVADLLTGPGRSPAEGEALIEWMKQHEDQWQTSTKSTS